MSSGKFVALLLIVTLIFLFPVVLLFRSAEKSHGTSRTSVACWYPLASAPETKGGDLLHILFVDAVGRKRGALVTETRIDPMNDPTGLIRDVRALKPLDPNDRPEIEVRIESEELTPMTRSFGPRNSAGLKRNKLPAGNSNPGAAHLRRSGFSFFPQTPR